MNFTNGDWLDLTYYDIDFFGGLSEKTYYLINDKNANIDWCYFIYQIIYYYVLYLHLIFLLLFTSCLVLLVIYEIHVLFGLKMNEDDVCLVDYAATHTILRDKIYLLKLTLIKAKGKEIEMNFTDGDGLDLTYYDIDFFGGPNEKKGIM